MRQGGKNTKQYQRISKVTTSQADGLQRGFTAEKQHKSMLLDNGDGMSEDRLSRTGVYGEVCVTLPASP